MPNKPFCLTLELRQDEELIREYEHYHQPENIWPEVLESIRESGIQDMRIYRLDTLLVMVIEADEGFSFDKKAKLDSDNPKVQDWERLMEKFQKVDEADAGAEKWKLLSPIFKL